MSASHLLPCLAVEHMWTGSNQSTTTMFSVSGNKPITGRLDSDELQDKAFCPTRQGWILVRDRLSATNTYLLDHDNRQRIQLPPLAIEPNLLIECACLLSDKPTSPSCVVLLVEPRDAIIWYYRIGQDEYSWTKHEYDLGTQGDEIWGFEKIVLNPIAACHGKFYFNARPTEMGVLEFCPAPVLSWIAMDDARYSDNEESAKPFLVESESELYLVRLLYHCAAYDETVVYKVDFSKNQWCPVDDLGGRAFFVGGPCNFGASCLATGEENGIRQNRVYALTAFGERCIKIFDVKDRTVELRNMEEAFVYRVKRGIDPKEAMLRTQHAFLWMPPTEIKAATASACQVVTLPS